MSENSREYTPLISNERINTSGRTRGNLRRKRYHLGCYVIIFLILLLTGLGLIASSFPLQTKMASIVQGIIADQVVLKKGSFILPVWTDPPVEMYKDFYIFNWTNPEEVLNGVKPNFKVLGPYKYREYRTKYIDYNHSNDCVISYIQHKTYEFDPVASYPLLDTENVVVLNIPVAAAPPKVSGEEEKDLLELAILTTNSKLHKELPAKDLIWGYTDPFILLLQLANKFPKGKKFQIQINDDPRDYQNLSSVGTGRCDLSDLGNFHQWDGNIYLNIWGDPAHNKVQGTEGLINPPFLEPGQQLFIWIDDIMRWAIIEDTGERYWHRGIYTWRFKTTKEFFMNQTAYTPNKYWYQDAPQGLIYIGNSTVPQGNSVWGSNPLFYKGDPGLADNVTGFTPDPSKYTYADVDPITGAVVYVHRQIQINFALRKADFLFFANLSEVTYFPVLYADEHAELSQMLYDTMVQKLLLVHIGYQAHWGILAFGILLLIPTLILGVCILRYIKFIRALKVIRDLTVL